MSKENRALELYFSLYHTQPDIKETTLLWIEALQTSFIAGKQGKAPNVFCLPIGLHSIGAMYFKQYPPSPLEMETAITLVEDKIMPLAKSLAVDGTLTLVGEGVSLLHKYQPGMTYTIDDIEILFRTLAQVAEGSPVSSSGLPAYTEFASLIIIVRECMHHLGFQRLVLKQII